MALSLLQAIQQKETSGQSNPYGYVSPAGAIGAYGMTPGTIAQFAGSAGYAGITPAQFQADPTAQDAIAATALDSYLSDYGGDVAKVGQAWLGGTGSVGASGVIDPYTGTSTTQYGKDLVGLVGATATSATSTSPFATGVADYGTGYGFSGSAMPGGGSFGDNLAQAGQLSDPGQYVAPAIAGAVSGATGLSSSIVGGVVNAVTGAGNALTWVGDVENWFVRGGLIIAGIAIVIVGLVFLMDPKLPQQAASAMGALAA